jgi:hypothetical protein
VVITYGFEPFESVRFDAFVLLNLCMNGEDDVLTVVLGWLRWPEGG